MIEPPPEVREHYELEVVEGERLSRGAGHLELVRTQEIIRRHLPAGPLEILDVGGGAGVHATWLADDGHVVHVIDPMPNHVEQAQRLAGPVGTTLRPVKQFSSLPEGSSQSRRYSARAPIS